MKLSFVLRIGLATTCVMALGLAARSNAAPHSSRGEQQTISHLRIGLNSAVSSLDAGRSSLAVVHWTAFLGLEGLMTLDAEGRVRPHLAISVRRPGPLVYVYTLRKGVKFWNGNELTAVDVANALNYYRYPALATSGFLGYPSVRAIKATDRYTVVVTLKRRDALWQYTPALYGWIFEKKFADEHKDTLGRPGVLTMGTGAFKFDSLDPTRGIELSANPNYWGGRAQIQRISVKFITDATAAGLAFRAGEVDFIPGLSNVRAFESASASKVQTISTCGTWWWGLNTKKAPFDDIHVRRAAAYAINKQGLISASGSPATPVSSLLTPLTLRSLGSKAEVSTALKSVRKYPFDLAKARAEMAQSRYPNGAATTIPAIAGVTSAQAEAVAGMLEKIGIKVEVKAMTGAQWSALGLGPRANIDSWFSGLTCITPDPAYYVRTLAHSKNARPGGLNRANYTSPAADALIDAGGRLSDPRKRLTEYRKLGELLAQDLPYIPLYDVKFSLALSRNFTFTGLHQFTVNTPGWARGIKPR